MAADHPAAALAGVVAIPVTPFGSGGAVDRAAYRAVVRRIVDGGVRTVTPNGNTGEFYALTPDERRHLVEDTVAEVGGAATVVAGVGHDTASAAAAARHARDAGAQMVMVHQPVHPYLAPEGWVHYHRAIAEAVPGLGVVPYLRNPRLDGEWIARLGAACPNVVGVKYAVPDAARFAAVARDAGLDRFVWVAGLAELYTPGYWAMGATGFTSGLVNVVPRLPLEMLDALRAGDYPGAAKVWDLVRGFEELRAARNAANNVSVVKEALALLGVCGRAVRPPSCLLPEAERHAVAAELARWGLEPRG